MTRTHLLWLKLKMLIAFAFPFSIAIAHVGFVETFSNGSDDGDWHLTNDPNRLLQIEGNGGNPGAYLHGQVFTPVPVWYVPLGTSPTHFLGDYYAGHVGGISFESKHLQWNAGARSRHHP